MDWIQVFNTLGFPAGVLLVFATAIWKVLLWLAPRIDQLFQKHMNFVDGVSRRLDETGRLLREIHREIVNGRDADNDKNGHDTSKK